MWSSDPLLSVSSWQYKKVLHLPPEIGVCNTDVTRGPNGTHVMVLEKITWQNGGQGYYNIFARTPADDGGDLSNNWVLMPPEKYFYWGGDHTDGHAFDYGDPTIRYLQSDEFFYIVPATPLQKWGDAPVAPGR